MKPTHARYWVVIFALALAMVMYIQRVAISQAIVPISADLHLDKAQTGLVLGAFGLSYALFEIPMGLLGDKLGVRWVLSQLVLIWSLFTALTGAAWNLTSLWILRFLFGAGEAGCFPNLTRMLSAWLPLNERVRAQAVMWAFGRWGGALAPPVAFFVIYHFGWRWGFVALAMLGVGWVAFFLPWFRNDPAEHKSVNKAELEMLEQSRALVLHDHGMPWYKLLLQKDIAFLGLQYFGFSYTWYFYVTWLPTWLQQARHLDPKTAAGYAMIPLALGGCGSIVSGFLPLSVPRKWVAIFGFFATAGLSLHHTRHRKCRTGDGADGAGQLLQRPDHADQLEHLCRDRQAVHRHGFLHHEHAGQFRGFCRAGGVRPDSTEHQQQLGDGDVHHGGGLGGLGAVLVFPGTRRQALGETLASPVITLKQEG